MMKLRNEGEVMEQDGCYMTKPSFGGRLHFTIRYTEPDGTVNWFHLAITDNIRRVGITNDQVFDHQKERKSL